MLVLDADSLMTGDCIVRLAAAMEADPDAGIIQTLPLIINRNTLFARAAAIRRARLRPGHRRPASSVWMGRDGNYWGHNAIIRTRAFAGALRPAGPARASRPSAATSSATISSRRR